MLVKIRVFRKFLKLLLLTLLLCGLTSTSPSSYPFQAHSSPSKALRLIILKFKGFSHTAGSKTRIHANPPTDPNFHCWANKFGIYSLIWAQVLKMECVQGLENKRGAKTCKSLINHYASVPRGVKRQSPGRSRLYRENGYRRTKGTKLRVWLYFCVHWHDAKMNRPQFAKGQVRS